MASECGVTHKQSVYDCIREVAYEIPVAWGFGHVEHTARSLNEKMTNHVRNVWTKASQSQLVRHSNGCNNSCPAWDECAVLDVKRDVYKRLVKETMQGSWVIL